MRGLGTPLADKHTSCLQLLGFEKRLIRGLCTIKARNHGNMSPWRAWQRDACLTQLENDAPGSFPCLTGPASSFGPRTLDLCHMQMHIVYHINAWKLREGCFPRADGAGRAVAL